MKKTLWALSTIAVFIFTTKSIVAAWSPTVNVTATASAHSQLNVTQISSIDLGIGNLSTRIANSQSYNMQIGLLSITLNDKKISQPVYITNTSKNQTLAFKANLANWRRADGQDIVTPIDNPSSSDVLIVTPVVGKLAPLQKIAIRVALNNYLSSDKEMFYKLFIEETPVPPKPIMSSNKINSLTVLPSAISVTTTVSLPVYISPSNPSTQLSWGAQQTAGGVSITLHNSGNSHMEITEIQIFEEGSDTPLSTQKTDLIVYPGEDVSFDSVIPSGKSVGSSAKSATSSDKSSDKASGKDSKDKEKGKNLKVRLVLANGDVIIIDKSQLK
ncbi:MAG: hypothetical protein A2X78_03470 [Gammaproteobacteria bacterium GWE2_37_16]|nr:MAG: hypothetical protein A2X78_03470 [Gammaproteobacteria bacterium GWE2_37_16]